MKVNRTIDTVSDEVDKRMAEQVGYVIEATATTSAEMVELLIKFFTMLFVGLVLSYVPGVLQVLPCCQKLMVGDNPTVVVQGAVEASTTDSESSSSQA